MTTPESSTPSTESPVPSVALTSSSTKKDRLPPVRRRGLSPAQTMQAAAMRAEGARVRSIASSLGKHTDQVSAALKLPETQLEIARRRELSKQISAASLPTVSAEGWIMAHEMALARDAKGFDATTRGLAAMEKIGASISGEDRRMELQHSGSIDTGAPISAIEQLKVLIGVVLAPQSATEPRSRTVIDASQ